MTPLPEKFSREGREVGEENLTFGFLRVFARKL